MPAYSFGLPYKRKDDNGVPGPGTGAAAFRDAAARGRVTSDPLPRLAGAFGSDGRPSDAFSTNSGLTPVRSLGAVCGKSAIEPALESPGPAAHSVLDAPLRRVGFSFGLRTEGSLRSVSLLDRNGSPRRQPIRQRPTPGPGAYEAVAVPIVSVKRAAPRFSMGVRTALETTAVAASRFGALPNMQERRHSSITQLEAERSQRRAIGPV